MNGMPLNKKVLSSLAGRELGHFTGAFPRARPLTPSQTGRRQAGRQASKQAGRQEGNHGLFLAERPGERNGESNRSARSRVALDDIGGMFLVLPGMDVAFRSMVR